MDVTHIHNGSNAYENENLQENFSISCVDFLQQTKLKFSIIPPRFTITTDNQNTKSILVRHSQKRNANGTTSVIKYFSNEKKLLNITLNL